MEAEVTQKPLPERGLHRFSVRDLLALMFLVSIVLAIAVATRESKYFRVFSSGWTWTSFALIAAIGYACRRQSVSRKTLAIASVVLYLVSMCVPAIGVFNDFEFGWMACGQSFVFGVSALGELTRDPPAVQPWPAIQIDKWISISCAIGGLANSLYILGTIWFQVARIRQRPQAATRVMAWSAVALMLIVVLSMCLMGDLTKLLPGYGLWVASALLLALAADDRA